MSRGVSIYLDIVRFLAACAVFVGHVSGQRFTAGVLWQAGPLMGDAVIVFFVLSGFVIACTTDQRERDGYSYALARAARILSVALPAIAVTIVLDAIGRSLRPDLYAASWGFSPDGLFWQYLGGALFLNRLWFLDTEVGSNLPYWSLCYEVWYYVIAGVALFAPRGLRVPALIALLLFVGPRIAAMFLLWLAGFLTYRICDAAGQPWAGGGDVSRRSGPWGGV